MEIIQKPTALTRGDHIILDLTEPGSMVVYHERTKQTHFLSPAAASVFLFADGSSLGSVYRAYRQTADASVIEEDIQKDFVRIVDELSDKGILKMEGLL